MIADEDADDATVYRVVVNDEEAYSIWPADRELPLGWRDAGASGAKAACLEHINQVWTDMRPLSLRRAMARAAEAPADAAPADEPGGEAAPADDLVQRLSRGEHPVRASVRPEGSASALREAIERGYVLLRFTDTAGGTELGVRLEPGAAIAEGPLRLVGRLTLDGVPVRCVAELDPVSLAGRGHLEPIA